jgi:hypothetical protein
MKQSKGSFGLRPPRKINLTGIDEGNAKRVLLSLIVATVAMILMGIAAVIVKHADVNGHWTLEMQESFVRLFNLDAEGNIPTWYSSSLLLCAALLLAWNSLAHASCSQMAGDLVMCELGSDH